MFQNELPNIQKLEIPSINITEEGSPDFGEQESGDTPTAQLRYKILGLDPRSPATDFDRTPILSPKSMKRLKARSLENLVRRDSYFELGISRPARLSYCETTSQGSIPEVLALPEIVSNLDKAVNLDPVTENSDKFDSCSSSSSSSVETISESHEEITVIRNPNAKSAEDASASNIASSFGSSIEKIEDSQESPRPVETCIEEQFHGPLDNVNRVLSIATKARDKEQLVSEMEKRITVWRDSISSETSEIINLSLSRESTSAQSDADVLPKEEILIEFDDVEIIKTLKIKPTSKYNNLTEGVKKGESVEKKNKNTEMDGKIFFQDKIFTPDRKNSNSAPKVNKVIFSFLFLTQHSKFHVSHIIPNSLYFQVRTPLGNRSNNHTKGNGMPMKSPQQILRGKAMSTHLCQENTPPRSIKSKHNGTQWDLDSTFLI